MCWKKKVRWNIFRWKKRQRLGKELFNAFRKLDLLQELIEDDEITEVMINGVQNIFVEKYGRLYLTDRHFVSRDKLDDVIQQIVAGTNRLVNEASPIPWIPDLPTARVLMWCCIRWR